ncbi:MAG: HAD family phosphatase [Candidatus Krumholzibacteriota bacterium]|nr:HAD family phosphatase [Candidatus Krumholzibacteriota bacterium]
MGPYDLICFDVDGTLIRHRTGKVIWEVLNRRFTGTDSINKERFRMYRAGEITYAEWVELDVQGWIDSGATRAQIVESVGEFEHHDGVLETVWELKKRGRELAIISGTLDIVIDTLFPDHPFGDVFSNVLDFDAEGRLVGWRATPFDLYGKPDALRGLAEKHGVPLERTAFIGDGDNDVPVVGVAGCVIAFNPRSKELEQRADHVVRGSDMRAVLELLE